MSDANFPDDGTFFFRQLLPGRDLAVDPSNPRERQLFSMAHRMLNCIYLVGDRSTGECIVIDPCWDVAAIKAIVKMQGMRLIGAVATHAHPDHIGGYFPFPLNHLLQPCRIPGIKELIDDGIKVYMHSSELKTAVRQTEVSMRGLIPVTHDQVLQVGGVTLKFMHTPGHCPGCVCILVTDSVGKVRGLISGDTLLPGTFGRVDLPGANPKAMAQSLKCLAELPDETVVYPGHYYNRMRLTSIGREKVAGFLNPTHENRLLTSMQPRLAIRIIRPFVCALYPFIQRARLFPIIVMLGLLILLRAGFYGLLAYVAIAWCLV
uniref:Metallo-beta-lactamase domain-containing protein n=1 Tax=Pyramimonas obovata TaxID=1411642 RepID=A0A7S0WXK9_9CHLO|mmetsp:Transcript_7665/g.15597  ORF Transcript_7665/g.15597 Transcript_7665/m.15597 type:complete len:319 (+) Transcript_7665:260-1216(+)|eukprot:CAMPEP_0118942490 /NCGR_PEP_ID=MMETSP1169-20130426/36270_1 /TAXON_ID=36882 /ORGANISM="Pyramimonas obovata, Strain CCMP722" /LENGTH=318 /DNA_ID=CAMNT_0006887511 /DNA_START=30 /DNA_END=986 /DNA_ORIENTATION=+